ncbi:nuclear transport factor 2 family protein [uncultured Ruegeria sp.]|uniref:nuclear transport factor 2 family protein n=1 Tax=uncultured Ruegeria sp. TaxID=259304 RepID=UPI002614DA39|nr:nuclear transport factor 2 family protein [uncultured Ruegeria sp.]
MASIRDVLNNLARDYAIAWSSGDADAVASFFARDGQITFNDSEPAKGRETIANLVRESYVSFPDLEVRCDMMRWAGTRAIFVWTREGHHAETGNHVVTRGWEEWELTPDYLVQSSSGWFDADDYQRQIDGA